jgi:DNA polymerase/3'-5' exonuclease PolX
LECTSLDSKLLIIDNDTSCSRISRRRISSHSCRSLVLSFHKVSNNSRRGALESTEIDVVVSHPSYTDTKNSQLLKSIINKLQSSGHIKDHLKVESDQYDGIVRLPAPSFSETSPPQPPYRRIKFNFVPWESFVFGQLHATGSPAFMIHVREQAAKLGYRLYPDKLEKRSKTAVEVFGVDGLKFIEEDKYDQREEGDLVHLDSEEDLFRFLRMKYVPPYKRNW